MPPGASEMTTILPIVKNPGLGFAQLDQQCLDKVRALCETQMHRRVHRPQLGYINL